MEVSTRGWKLSITSAQTRPHISPQERSQAARNIVASPLVELTQEGGYLGYAWKSQAAIQEEPFSVCLTRVTLWKEWPAPATIGSLLTIRAGKAISMAAPSLSLGGFAFIVVCSLSDSIFSFIYFSEDGPMEVCRKLMNSICGPVNLKGKK